MATREMIAVDGNEAAASVAHRVGEPFGTLVLAVAVTVIEASLILSMMLAGGADKATQEIFVHTAAG